jgi:hypothetical protein
MSEPTPSSADGGSQPRKAPAAKVGNVVAYKRSDPITGVVEELLGVVVRAAEKELPLLIRPLQHYAHEVDPADVVDVSS